MDPNCQMNHPNIEAKSEHVKNITIYRHITIIKFMK